MALSSIPDILDDIRAGKMVILMDDEDRENEGDLIVAAEAVTPEIITFFSSEACGLICMPLTEERARRLQLPLMVRDNLSSPNRGAVELGWTYPLSKKLKGYIQVFDGYAESLIDYDHRCTRIGMGFLLADWL